MTFPRIINFVMLCQLVRAKYKSKYFNFTTCLLELKNLLFFQVPL